MATVNWVRISLVALASLVSPVGVGTAQGQTSAQAGLVPGQVESCPGAEFPRRLSSGTMAGQLISRPDPIYPPEAIKAHVSGSVVLMVCIGVDGHVKKAVPISGPEMLRKSYIDAVSRWVYRPYILDGAAVPVITTVTVNFAMGASAADDSGCENARPGDPDSPVRVSSGTMFGQSLWSPHPEFPPEARKAHVSGAAVVRVCVGRDGRVKRVQPVSGPEMLRKAVVDAVSDWVYRPYLIDGKPVAVDTTITVIMHGGGA